MTDYYFSVWRQPWGHLRILELLQDHGFFTRTIVKALFCSRMLRYSVHSVRYCSRTVDLSNALVCTILSICFHQLLQDLQYVNANSSPGCRFVNASVCSILSICLPSFVQTCWLINCHLAYECWIASVSFCLILMICFPWMTLTWSIAFTATPFRELSVMLSFSCPSVSLYLCMFVASMQFLF